MGCGPSFAKTNFDYPSSGPDVGGVRATLVSISHLYCLAQHLAEWPDYYCLVDTRKRSAYDKAHVVNAEHVSDISSDIAGRLTEMTVIIYGDKDTSPAIQGLLDQMRTAGAVPTAVYLLEGPFSAFSRRYKVIMSNFLKTQGEQPGPVEIIPSTKTNPAVYAIHRNQFQHCKATIAYLGCNTVINISSRRLFLKTAAIRLENIQFDSVNEPYDEAINSFTKFVEEKPKAPNKGNLLLIDETGCDYGALLCGWYWYMKGHDLEKICEHLTNKIGELDPWYLDVLRAWTET